jgi:uncharacterized membrane protein
MLLVFLFYVVFTPVSTILGNLAENSGVNEYIVLAVTMISNFVLEYLYTRYVVYRNSCDTAKEKSWSMANPGGRQIPQYARERFWRIRAI